LFDAGFQLSFLSTIGLIYFAPILEKRMDFFPPLLGEVRWGLSVWLGLKEIIITTFSAIIFTAPLIIYSFGRFSLIAPLANLLVLPAVPLAMLTGFITLASGIIFPALGHLLSYVSWVVLAYIIKVTEFLSQVRFSSISLSLPWWLMVIFYGILIYIIYVGWQKNKK
jgi:competence protein ComEC